MKIYRSFASKETKDKYICKSDITKELLQEMNLPNFVTVAMAKQVFDNIKDENEYILVRRGMSNNKTRSRITKYIKKYVLYKHLVN